jgi:hypothetical protein
MSQLLKVYVQNVSRIPPNQLPTKFINKYIIK